MTAKVSREKALLTFLLGALMRGENPWFYQGREKEQSDNRIGELKASRDIDKENTSG